MLKYILIANLVLFFSLYSMAQKKDSAYYVQLLCKSTNEGLPFGKIILNEVTKGTTDLNGIAKLDKKYLYSGQSDFKNKVFLKAVVVGFKVISFSTEILLLNDTLVLKMEDNHFTLGEIEVVSYRVPLIDPDKGPKRKCWKKKKKIVIEIKDTAICYSEKDLSDYQLLKNGKWEIKSTNGSGVDAESWFKYLVKQITYPEAAKEWNIQETVYLRFQLNEKGCLRNIKILKANNPVLALEVARALALMPCLVQRGMHGEYLKPWGLQEFVLPVAFKLR